MIEEIFGVNILRGIVLKEGILWVINLKLNFKSILLSEF